MADNTPESPEKSQATARYETDEHAEKRFLGWRLMGVVVSVIFVLALISFLVDWAVIGPLEGRAF